MRAVPLAYPTYASFVWLAAAVLLLSLLLATGASMPAFLVGRVRTFHRAPVALL